MALSKLDEGSPFPVNKVIVSLADAQRTDQCREPDDPQMLVVDDVDKSLRSTNDPSIQYGTVLTLSGGNCFVDPLPALETASSGGWVFLDTGDGVDEANERNGAISNLVNFIAGGLSLESDSTLLNLETNESCNNVTDKGGIAIACRTKGEMLEAASILRSMDSGTLITTESGILLQSDRVDDTSSSLVESLRYALVLPFDIPLWKAAVLVFVDAP